VLASGTGYELAAANLPQKVHFVPHVAPVQIQPVTMIEDPWDRPPEQLTHQNVSQRLEDGRRRPFEQVGDSDP